MLTLQTENMPEHGVLHLTLLNPQLVDILVWCSVLQVLYQSEIHKLRLQVV